MDRTYLRDQYRKSFNYDASWSVEKKRDMYIKFLEDMTISNYSNVCAVRDSLREDTDANTEK